MPNFQHFADLQITGPLSLKQSLSDFQSPTPPSNPNRPAVFIIPQEANFTAKFTIGAASQNAYHERISGKALLFTKAGLGFPKFIAADQLRAEPNGYLQGDRLVLRVTVEVKGRDEEPMAD